MKKCEECLEVLVPYGSMTPTHCPECNSRLVYAKKVGGENSRHLMCNNAECPGKVVGHLERWVEIQEIKQVGPKVIDGLIANGVNTPIDLYNAKPDVLIKACNSEANGKKILNNINASKNMPLNKFLTGLNIPTLGKTNGKRLMKKFKTLGGVLKATADDVETIGGIGSNAAKIVNGLKTRKKFILDLYKLVNVEKPVEDVSAKLKDLSFCATGALSIKREDLHDIIEKNGGSVKKSVSKGLNFLITNSDKATSKRTKAEGLGVKIINEEVFYKMIAED